MLTHSDRQFGAYITRLVQKENLTQDESRDAFCKILGDETTQMQQGAFLAALAAKGETAQEVAGGWQAIYDLDTNKVDLDGLAPVVDNSGTGMDTFKTYNISTAASLLAAAGGIKMARHGARAITSICGTVDMAEALGVDVDCPIDQVAESIKSAGIGLFNGMSPQVHPTAISRILSNICFGSTLNIAASLANPAFPRFGLRGVYSKQMIMPVIQVMKTIGYRKALVFHGSIDQSDKGMDEASVCGTTDCAELTEDGNIRQSSFRSEELGLKIHAPDELAPLSDIETEAKAFVALVQGRTNGARCDAALLNAALIYYLVGAADTFADGLACAREALDSGRAFETLSRWVVSQNRYPDKGIQKLRSLVN
jgi:anthranilate phosphoribosyltransferase